MREIFHAVLMIVAVGVIFNILAAVFRSIAGLFTDEDASASPARNPVATPSPGVPVRPNDSSGRPLSGAATIPTPKRPAKLELAVAYNARLAGSSYLIVRVRGGPDGGRVGGVTYSLSCTVSVHQLDYALGDRRSGVINPEAFRGLFTLNDPLPDDDTWAPLAVIPLEHVLPPRAGSFLYSFKCHAYESAKKTYVGSPSTVGGVLADVEYATIFNLPGPGYLDEIDWLSLRENVLSFVEGVVQCCEADVPDKRAKVRSFVESLTPPVTSLARAAMMRVAIGRAYVSVKPVSALDYGMLEAVRLSQDAVLIESLAGLAFQLACREPLNSEVRRVFAKVKATYDVNVNGHHVRDVDPLPPVVPVVAPVPVADPIVPPFEMRLEPIEEAGRIKAAEVQVRGHAVVLLGAQAELTFWLCDETAGDEPFLLSSGDIDQVHERAVHHHRWKKDEHDSTEWQSVGVVRFNQVMPPSGGARRICVAGRIGFAGLRRLHGFDKTTRSAPLTMNIAVPGYESIRNKRRGLRYRAFVLAVGLALLSGKGPTYRQDRALQKFAKLLCTGILDLQLAEDCHNELLTLIDSDVEHTHHGLIRQLDQLAAQAYPVLKSQLLEALVEVMASRKVRSKESRDFLDYGRRVLS